MRRKTAKEILAASFQELAAENYIIEMLGEQY